MTRKLISGGSWFDVPRHCRSASRNHYEPGNTFSHYGFRVVCNEPERLIATDKVISGGSWYNLPLGCRSASRLHDLPGVTNNNSGFRVVCWEAKS